MCASAVLADGDAMVIPQIDMTPQDGIIAVEARALGMGAGRVTATLTIEKSDGGGTISTSQSRDITLTQGSDDLVASTSFSVQPDLALTATLTMVSDGVVVASSTVSIADN
ncbi:hypothetical protein KDD17_07480 [Sulfitobacter albidus]|uniref:Uncharacterized protein n=1 Tax=Sulfitobacter albidus TaxID=2829501 RepID=A0A975JFW9_9RHOB|nr:curli-like amyloid fiber formation chaperone CsgH [Sulfitobacter albidus]QUJ77774.1 hypothetical protein KDD17_07480 [Sulfitobacter albidus]